MTTIVTGRTPTNDSGGFGYLLGIVAIIGFVIVLFYFGLPVIQNLGPVQLNVPAPQIVVPNKIDVNVKQTK